MYLVALTGYALPEDVAKAKEAGFDRHLAKPPSLETIEDVIASCGDASQPLTESSPR
jgi:CheY-like chemotaxis protein